MQQKKRTVMRMAWLLGIFCLSCIVVIGCSSNNKQADNQQQTQTPAKETSQPKETPQATEQPPENVELRVLWWGSEGRHNITMKVIDLFQQKYPHIKISPEFSGFDGYWDKLSVQVSGGSAPDVIQMSYAYLADYANRQALLEVSDQGIDFSAVDEGTLSTGKVGGQLYAIPAGISSYTFIYDEAMLAKAGITLSEKWTWDELADILIEATKKLGGDAFGIMDQDGNPDLLKYYVMQQGMNFFEGNQIGFSEEVLQQYFAYWERLREAGAVPSAELSSSLSGIPMEQYPIVTGRAPFQVLTSNAFTGLENLANRPLQMAPVPGDASGQEVAFVTPSMYWSVYGKSKHPKEAAMLIDFIINDPEAGKILAADRGVPVSSEIRELLKPTLSEADQKQFQYIDEVAKVSTPVDIIEPKGAGEVRALLGSTAQELHFKKKTTEQAAKEFIQKANAILEKMK